MNILLIPALVSDDSPRIIQDLIDRGVLPQTDKPNRSDVVAFNAPLIAARVKGHDVYVESEKYLIPSVKHSAKRVFIIDGEIVPGQNITMYTAKIAEGEDVYELLKQKGIEQKAALGAG